MYRIEYAQDRIYGLAHAPRSRFTRKSPNTIRRYGGIIYSYNLVIAINVFGKHWVVVDHDGVELNQTTKRHIRAAHNVLDKTLESDHGIVPPNNN